MPFLNVRQLEYTYFLVENAEMFVLYCHDLLFDDISNGPNFSFPITCAFINVINVITFDAKTPRNHLLSLNCSTIRNLRKI